MDNGPEFAIKALDCWAQELKVKLEFIHPDKPMGNGFSESFNRRFCIDEWSTPFASHSHLAE